MKIAIIYDVFREDTLGVHYQKALTQLGLEVKHFWLKDSSGIEPIFDAYLRIDDGDYKHDIPHDKLKPSFFYASDLHLKKPFLAIKKAARFYNHVFCAQYSGYLKLMSVGKNRVSWLPHACDPGLTRDLGLERKLDIAFVGNDGGNPRKFLLQEIKEQFPNSYIGNAPYMDMGKIYSNAKIGFNYSIKNDINMRIFEVASCGAMLLTNHIDDEGFDRLFADKKNLAVYRSPKEIFSMIEYYLHSDKDRNAIAQAGKDLVIANHTYAKRASLILDKIKQWKNIAAI